MLLLQDLHIRPRLYPACETSVHTQWALQQRPHCRRARKWLGVQCQASRDVPPRRASGGSGRLTSPPISAEVCYPMMMF